MLTAPDSRERLAGYWEGVIASAVTRHGALEARVCVATRQVKGAEDEIRCLVEALRAPQPVAARGAALASELLRDGGGPVYNPMSPRCLVREVQVARNRLSAAISDD
ncbi:MAG: hypothetical protein JWN96_1949 [Mycobacterium sp.]|nr:hypothetical protein [Mycobacterium sp.]